MSRLWLWCAVALLPSCGTRRAEWRALEDPADADAWEKLGNARRRAFQPHLAVEAYAQAYQLDPSRDYLRSRMRRASSREVERLRRDALTMPGDDEMWGDLGDALVIMGDDEGATSAYLRAYQIDPYDAEWHDALRRLGADEALEAAMTESLDETNDESLGDWGDLLMSQGRSDEACDAYRRAAELDPWDEEWIRHASTCGFEPPEGYAPTADTGLVGAIVHEGLGGLGYYGGVPASPGLPEASDVASLQSRVDGDVGLLVRLGQAYLRAGDAEQAQETLWGALLVAPTHSEALQSYLMVTGRTALDVREALYATFPDDDEVVGALGDAYLALGDHDRAEAKYVEAHELDPDDPEWDAKLVLIGEAP